MSDRIRTVDMSDPAVVLDCYKKLNVAYKELKAENEKLRDGVRSTIQERDVLSGENFDLRAENEKLRAALKLFADIAKQTEHWSGPPVSVPLYVIRAAAAVLKEQ